MLFSVPEDISSHFPKVKSRLSAGFFLTRNHSRGCNRYHDKDQFTGLTKNPDVYLSLLIKKRTRKWLQRGNTPTFRRSSPERQINKQHRLLYKRAI